MVEMKVYHCTNAEDNPMPVWMQMKPHQQKCLKKRNGYCRTIQTKS
ncbi:MAG: hypothetical protein ACLSCV_10945 [Acutalibacteraceae bacterium]